MIRVTEPAIQASAESGSVISFETTDLAGNPVKSEELFSPYKLTMINLWGTFCGPCIQEMPGLETLYQTMKAKNVNVIGVVVDIALERNRRGAAGNGHPDHLLCGFAGTACRETGCGLPERGCL